MTGRYDNLALYSKLDNDGQVRQCIVVRYMNRNRPSDRMIHIVRAGENLMDIAYHYYNDSTLWYVIADKNISVKDPFELSIGQELIIPRI